MLKTKKAGLVTKLLIFGLCIYAGITLWSLHTRIENTEEELVGLHSQLETQTQRNAELSDSIENSGEIEHRKDIARQKLGLLEPGEKVFHISD